MTNGQALVSFRFVIFSTAYCLSPLVLIQFCSLNSAFFRACHLVFLADRTSDEKFTVLIRGSLAKLYLVGGQFCCVLVLIAR